MLFMEVAWDAANLREKLTPPSSNTQPYALEEIEERTNPARPSEQGYATVLSERDREVKSRSWSRGCCEASDQ